MTRIRNLVSAHLGACLSFLPVPFPMSFFKTLNARSMATSGLLGHLRSRFCPAVDLGQFTLAANERILGVHITVTFSDDPHEPCPEWCGVFDSVILMGRVVRFQMKNITCIKNNQSRLRSSVQKGSKISKLSLILWPHCHDRQFTSFTGTQETLTETDA